MKLFKFTYRKDYGDEWYVQFLFTKRWALFQACVSWNDYASWPYIQIKSGSGSTFSLMFWAYKFGFDFDILSITWDWSKWNDD